MAKTTLHRRRFLQLGAAAAAAGAALTAPSFLRRRGRAHAQSQGAGDGRLLFVIAASGGASIIDSLLPVAASEVTTGDADRLAVYPDSVIAQPTGSNLRCVRNLGLPGLFESSYDTTQFLARHAADTAVVCVENTSVNHVVAQKRAITGAGIDGGRTIMEAVAETHGSALPLASCNMASGGFIEPGDRSDVPDHARAEIINDPRLFAVATHGARGVQGAPAQSLIERARGVRERLDDASPFGERFTTSALRQRYLDLRRRLGPQLEQADLITKLMLFQNSPAIPLEKFGLESSPELDKLRETFPLLTEDRLQSQAALAFLLARYQVSCALAMGPGFEPNFLPDGTIADTPIAFDFSHSDHIVTQNVMWSRVLMATDGLISLLKSQPDGDGTLWDRSLIYIATDFGRSKDRPAGAQSFGTGHHLNNGNILVSPLLRGNRVYGGVDPNTCLTHGFDPKTGDPDTGAIMREGHLYSLVAQALGVDFTGRHDMSGLIR